MSGKLDPQLNAVAVILAAGRGERMGFPKGLLEAGGGRTFLERLVATFAEAGARSLAVLGADAEAIRSRHPGLWAVDNADWKAGQWSSVRVGLEAALAAGARVVLVQPVDAPRVRVATALRVVGALERFPAAVSFYRDTPGHPVALTAAGARQVLAQTDADSFATALTALDGAGVESGDPAIVENINTPAEYQKIFGRPPFGVG